MRWFITGCSSGLGRALAEGLAADGEHIVATARRPEVLADLVARYPDTVLAVPLDVRDAYACENAVATAINGLGGIDVLVNNAGYGQFGAVEEVTDEQLADQFATNVYGPWRLTRLVLPHWRERGTGRALFVSSVAGTMPFPGLSAYTASKFALEGMAESLAQEAGPLGVKVSILQCGGFATPYGKHLTEPGLHARVYDQAYGGMLDAMRNLEVLPQINQPSVFVDAVRKVVTTAQPALRVPVGLDAPGALTAALEARLKELRDN
ncbi:SDR family oxidoreductase [Hamadaea tsunoensis]|uniref:SDR family oxidoreductase n=1 Tax=Hamadaea tsunoensis TaxID=53368 RepID=UPI0003FC630C|nr:SDR family oxidoreductase [Hamadaea tsunoensis]